MAHSLSKMIALGFGPAYARDPDILVALDKAEDLIRKNPGVSREWLLVCAWNQGRIDGITELGQRFGATATKPPKSLPDYTACCSRCGSKVKVNGPAEFIECNACLAVDGVGQ